MTHFTMAPPGGPDTFKVFKDNRNDQLDDFVKLVIVSRWGLVSPGPNVPLTAATPTVCKVPNEGPAEAKVAASHPTSGDQTWEGALVAATGIAEEATVLHGGGHYTQAEFLNVMSWSVAHEVGHLLVGAEHPGTSSTALMGLPPGPGRQGISVIQTDVTEMSMIDLKDKNSVNE